MSEMKNCPLYERKDGVLTPVGANSASASTIKLSEQTGSILAPGAITEAGEPEAAAVKARAGWVRRFLNQGKSAAEAERLADLTFSPATRAPFFSGPARKPAGPGRKSFFGGRTADLTEPKGKA